MILRAGASSSTFNFKKELDILLEHDRVGKFIIEARKTWRTFDYNKAYINI